MRPAPLYLAVLAVLCSFISLRSSGQSILVNGNAPPFYSFDTGSCSLTPLSSPVRGLAPPFYGYLSMALRGDTLYYTTQGGLLCRFVPGDTASMTVLRTGLFTVVLTVDTSGWLYWMVYAELFKYDPYHDQVYDLGLVNYPPSGDLVFYRNELIMSSPEGLIAVNLKNPSESHVFMETPGYSFFGLASTIASCSQHSIIGFGQTDTTSSAFVIDMDNSTIRLLCRLPFYINDAASSGEAGGYGLAPVGFPGGDTTQCTGSPIVLDAGNPGASYLWDDNSTGQTRTVDQPGKYWVRVTRDGCTAADTIQCTFIPPPSVKFPTDTLLCTTDSLTLDASFPNTAYRWQDGSVQPTYTVTHSGVYTVQATNQCATVNDSARVRFEDCSCAVYVPNAFTPGPGVNGLFQPRYRCTLNYHVEDYQLDVYNRWGQRIWGTRDLKAGWDGSYQGRPQSSDSYVWELVYRDIQGDRYVHKKGIVFLIR